MHRLRRLFAAIAIDVGPLRRHRDFRLLFIGQLVTFLGSMVTYVALPYQAYQLTGSSLVAGALSVAEFAPLISMAMIGGALADAQDRRRMVQLTELGFAGASAALVVNATLDAPRSSSYPAIGSTLLQVANWSIVRQWNRSFRRWPVL